MSLTGAIPGTVAGAARTLHGAFRREPTRKRRVLQLLIAAFCSTAAIGATPEHAAADPPASERMFYALINPDSTVSLQITCPSSLDDNDAWWKDCGTFFALTGDKKSPGPNPLKSAWLNAKEQAAQLTLDADMTYANWSGGTPELRDNIRVRLLRRTRAIVARNKVYEILQSSKAPDDVLASTLDSLQRHLRADPKASSLFHYCPGAAGNISIDSRHPLFEKWMQAVRNPEFARYFNEEVAGAFRQRLDASGNSGATARQELLDQLLSEKEVLSKIH